MTNNVCLYTDGACSGNPGPGGWAAILQMGPHEKVLTGFAPDTTNNRMELTAVIQGLSALNRPCDVTVTTDSRYVVDAVEKGWAVGWRARGWKKADKKPALNADLWATILTLCETHRVRFVWVRGHEDHPQNIRCDALAVAEIEKHRKNDS